MQRITIELTTSRGKPLKLQIIGNSLHIYLQNDYVGLLTPDDLLKHCGRGLEI